MSQRVPVSAAARSRRIGMGAAVVVTCLVVAGAMSPVLMAGKPAGPAKPPSTTTTGVTATFRCSGSFVGGVLTSSCPDGILSDGAPYTGDPTVSTARGAFIYTSGSYDDFQLRFDGVGGRALTLDLGTLVKAATCGGKLPCRKNFSAVTITKTLFSQGLLVRPANADGSDFAGGLHKMTVGQTLPAKLKMNFPGTDTFGNYMVYTLRYNPRDYAGSSFVYVTRTGDTTWTVEAGGYLTTEDKGWAELVASPDGSAGRTQTHEGWYLMPFSLDIEK